MIKKILFLLILLPLNLSATEISGRLTITPLIGIENVQEFEPTSHMQTRYMYGVTTIYRFPILALETEFTHAQNINNDSSTNTSYKNSEDKVRLGMRGSTVLGQYIGTYLRGGAQFRKNSLTTTTNNTVQTSTSLTKVQPYLGTGIDIKLLPIISIMADILVTYTPTTDPNLRSYELQPSIGLLLRFK